MVILNESKHLGIDTFSFLKLQSNTDSITMLARIAHTKNAHFYNKPQLGHLTAVLTAISVWQWRLKPSDLLDGFYSNLSKQNHK